MAKGAITIKSDIDFGKLEKSFEKAPNLISSKINVFLVDSLVPIEREVKLTTPVNDGILYNSIGSEIKGVGLEQTGAVGTPVEYAPFVELPTKPHWPPFKAIEFWVKNKFKLRGSALFLVTRAIQKKIAQKGTEGHFMFRDAFEKTEPKIAKDWDLLWAKIIKQDL